MELEHSFSVPVPAERAWDVLLDVERVAPCMPGATLDSVDGDEIKARIKVKVGPIQMTYAGTAKFTERDEKARVVVLQASGKETRGAGTASATIRSTLTPEGDSTKVDVHTTLNVTGKPAQFGRGVMAEVGGRLVGIFADNLAAMIAAGQAGGSDTKAAPAADAKPAGTRAAPADNAAANSAPPPGKQDAAEPDEALPIDVLNLNGRAWSSLRRDGIQTLGDLTRRTGQQLLSIDGVGPAAVADIRARLGERGLALADKPEDGLAAAEELADAELAAADELAEDLSAAQLAAVTPLHRDTAELAQTEPEATAPAWQPPDNEALDLLDVAGLPMLKRVVPAAAGLAAVALVVFGLRRRARRK